MSDGPDRTPGTRWDVGLIIDLAAETSPETASWTDRFHPEETWLARRKRELGVNDEGVGKGDSGTFQRSAFSGGQTRLHGAEYFWFFTWLMLGTAMAFVPYALLYRPKTYLQD